jgi:hypothetical protein
MMLTKRHFLLITSLLCVPPVYLAAAEVFCELIFFDDTEKNLVPITVLETVEIINALPKLKTPGPGSRMPMLSRQLYMALGTFPLRWKTATLL